MNWHQLEKSTYSAQLVIAIVGLLLFTFWGEQSACQDSIDRFDLVNRHNVQVSEIDTLASLSVGNGSFAYTVDATGLQTFPEHYEKGISLGTQSEWGWHSFPNTGNYTIEDIAEKFTIASGREVPYATQHDNGRKAAATHWLRTNPHRLHLGQVGLVLIKANGEEANVDDIKEIDQELNLWTGDIDSRFTFEGEPVHVELFGHQNRDQISVRIKSPLISEERLRVKMRFPYGSDCHVCPGYDWNSPEKHTTTASESGNGVLFQRTLDKTEYFVDVNWESDAEIKNPDKHHYQLAPVANEDTFSFSVLFSDEKPGEPADKFADTKQNSIKHWEEFWTTGGAIDFSGSTDPRAHELERRVVLSQYLTKIQCTGDLPPQETGLTMNSWYGKFHLEMHWWHGVHFALWNRTDQLEKSLDWYSKVLPKAKETAQWQGYDGARWQKMTGPNGRKGPSDVGEFLVWQQPHMIYYAEELYRQNPSKKILENYKERVFETAEFMASFATLDESDGYYHLNPPLIPAQELFEKETTRDPPFEVAYWHYGLSVAQEWRKRLGLSPDKKWQRVIDKLAPLAVKDGLYLPDRNSPNAYTDDHYRHDHPIVVGTYGLLPSHEIVDKKIMTRTYNEIFNDWDWPSTWGWDYPMMAMAATKLGMPEKAVDALFMDVQKNTYLKNGHNYQDKRLRLYLPGNGALLSAVALMAAGWENGPDTDTPGFPDNGEWNVKWENIRKMQ
ncbi:hypothetical protein NC796_16275 [Aliifodinibius sp. S!AR15-10]|uniref:hypothetical protein n=1 Tax=Aliifodinibius sp. S!AR15-10 TaxID=2950437 RepID=UPI0028630F03|nr:hypothetical protein [Aliifodinibius sp. S!AR15-10]MDR8392713.1 hypothetical protein [Aliifodinibius sp. S!AR15-10]